MLAMAVVNHQAGGGSGSGGMEEEDDLLTRLRKLHQTLQECHWRVGVMDQHIKAHPPKYQINTQVQQTSGFKLQNENHINVDIKQVTSKVMNGTPEVMKEMPEVMNGTHEVMKEMPEVMNETHEVMKEMPEVMNGTHEVMKEMPEVMNGTPEVMNGTAHQEESVDLEELDDNEVFITVNNGLSHVGSSNWCSVQSEEMGQADLKYQQPVEVRENITYLAEKHVRELFDMFQSRSSSFEGERECFTPEKIKINGPFLDSNGGWETMSYPSHKIVNHAYDNEIINFDPHRIMNGDSKNGNTTEVKSKPKNVIGNGMSVNANEKINVEEEKVRMNGTLNGAYTPCVREGEKRHVSVSEVNGREELDNEKECIIKAVMPGQRKVDIPLNNLEDVGEHTVNHVDTETCNKDIAASIKRNNYARSKAVPAFGTAVTPIYDDDTVCFSKSKLQKSERKSVDRGTEFCGRSVDRNTELCGKSVDRSTEFCGKSVDRGTEFCGKSVDRGTEFCGKSVDRGTEFCGKSVDRGTEFCGLTQPVIVPGNEEENILKRGDSSDITSVGNDGDADLYQAVTPPYVPAPEITDSLDVVKKSLDHLRNHFSMLHNAFTQSPKDGDMDDTSATSQNLVEVGQIRFQSNTETFDEGLIGHSHPALEQRYSEKIKCTRKSKIKNVDNSILSQRRPFQSSDDSHPNLVATIKDSDKNKMLVIRSEEDFTSKGVYKNFKDFSYMVILFMILVMLFLFAFYLLITVPIVTITVRHNGGSVAF